MADTAKVPVKTIGGQPLWVWGVAGAATIAAAFYLYRKNAAASPAAAGPASPASPAAPAAPSGPLGYGTSIESTIADLHASPTIVRQCPPGYNYRTRGPHAGHCVRASKAP